MGGGWRRTTVTGVLALSLISPGIAGVAASQEDHPRAVRVLTRADATPAKPVDRVPTLPPVSVHPIERPLRSAHPQPAGSSVTQVVRVPVVGGSLALATASSVVELQPRGRTTWSARLPPVRVVDGRGSHRGWTVRWVVRSVRTAGARGGAVPSMVWLDPADPIVVHGTAGGLSAGAEAKGARAGRTLFRARPGWGGGTYEGGGTISLRLPHWADPDTVVVELGYAVS